MDPSGHMFIEYALKGALIGGVAAGVADFAVQFLVKGYNNINWGEVFGFTFAGAFIGALAPFSPNFAMAMGGYLAGYWAYNGLDNGGLGWTIFGYLAGYENLQNDFLTLNNPNAPWWLKSLAMGDVILNTVLGGSLISGIGSGIRSMKLAIQLRNLSGAERLIYLERLAAEFGVDLVKSNRFYRPLGTRVIEYKAAALANPFKLAGGFFHELAHIQQEFGALGRVVVPLQRFSAWASENIWKSLGITYPLYLLNPVEVNSFMSGLAYLENPASIVLGRTIDYCLFVHKLQPVCDW
jgi:hypothetical protein